VSDPAVTFDQVWKKFRRGERHDTLRDLVPAAVARLLGRSRDGELKAQEFWATRDVSFEVHPGDALGIIGPNGAGKSTILKILTRILRPDRGQCRARGRVGALIEVAAGFHPDLTGRENIWLQGAIMGMRRAEIARRMDAIIEFAGVRDHVDTPVKRYSSGLHARLGFSIAAHLDPDVLVIDEVLAVGDLACQERCLERMQEFRRKGTAIIFVSHNLGAVAELCNKVLVLAEGGTQIIAPPAEAIACYSTTYRRASAAADSYGTGTLDVVDHSGASVTSVEAGASMTARAVVHLTHAEAPLSSTLRVRRIDDGEIVFVTTSQSVGCPPRQVTPPATLDIRWNFKANLARGYYMLEVLVIEAARRECLVLVSSPQFAVCESNSERGSVYLACQCSFQAGGEPAQERVPVTSAEVFG
jgi:ABC-type polysaccharide/polyol phosphate transport system ATPase subunit